MTTIAGILATLAVSHLSGTLLGSLLTRFAFLGFGPKLKIARHTLRIGKALRAAFNQQPTTKNRTELQRWLKENDPQNELKLGDGIKID